MMQGQQQRNAQLYIKAKFSKNHHMSSTTYNDVGDLSLFYGEKQMFTTLKILSLHLRDAGKTTLPLSTPHTLTVRDAVKRGVWVQQ